MRQVQDVPASTWLKESFSDLKMKDDKFKDSVCPSASAC